MNNMVKLLYNCTNRYSFHFIGLVFYCSLFYTLFIFSGDELFLHKNMLMIQSSAIFLFISVMLMYFKLLYNEKKNPDFRLKNQTIKSMAKNIEDFQFNTAIARSMELLNGINGYINEGEINKEIFQNCIETLLKILAPLAPHFMEEEWHILGKTTSIHNEAWPEINEKEMQGGKIIIPVQVNGKLKAQVEVSSALSKEEILEEVKKDAKVAKLIENNDIVKEIYVPRKILNLVVKK